MMTTGEKVFLVCVFLYAVIGITTFSYIANRNADAGIDPWGSPKAFFSSVAWPVFWSSELSYGWVHSLRHPATLICTDISGNRWPVEADGTCRIPFRPGR